MKRTKWTIAAALVLAIGYVPSIYSQTTKTTEMRVPATASITSTVKVSIPFAFTAAGKSFAPGAYYIGPANEGNEMAIKSVSGKSAVMAPTNLVSVANKVVPPKLVFHKYGDQYFLAQTWLKYSDEGREFFVTPEELKMAREYSQKTVVLALVKNMGISAVPAWSSRISPPAQVR
jgi:hypothetical protein